MIKEIEISLLIIWGIALTTLLTYGTYITFQGLEWSFISIIFMTVVALVVYTLTTITMIMLLLEIEGI